MLFVEYEIQLESNGVFLECLSKLRQKLYDILCLMQHTALTETDVSFHTRIRDEYLNGILRHSKHYERSLFIVGRIKHLLQNISASLPLSSVRCVIH